MDILQIPIELIMRDPNQVRKIFNAEKLDGLARSVEEVGVLHPVLVKQTSSGYQLVAGERRLEAAKRSGCTTIPAVILAPGVEVKQIQLIENLQREDLNPVERAIAVKEFMEMDHLNKVNAAKKLGVPRTTLTDWLDILGVEDRYQRSVVDNFYGGDSPVTLSHVAEAKALASRLKSPTMCNVILNAVIDYKLSKVETREVCTLVRNSADTSVDEAVKAVRRPAEVNKLAKSTEDDRKAVEKNIEKWVAILERSTNTVSQLSKVAPRYLGTDDKVRIINQLQELQNLVDQALQRMADDDNSDIQAS